MESLSTVKKGLSLVEQAGMRKFNFAGREPFLYPKFLGSIIDYCKKELRLESVSIVTNGSLVTKRFSREHGAYIDVLAVSCDSFNGQSNIGIDPRSGK